MILGFESKDDPDAMKLLAAIQEHKIVGYPVDGNPGIKWKRVSVLAVYRTDDDNA